MTLRHRLLLMLSALLLILLVGIGLSGYFLSRFVRDAEAITQDNYRTLLYVEQMHGSLDSLLLLPPSPEGSDDDHLADFTRTLARQGANLTEPGEATLQKELESLARRLDTTAAPAERARLGLAAKARMNRIFTLNEAVVEQRTQQARASAARVILYSSLLAAIALIVAIAYLYRFPRLITKPIEAINARIRAVAGGDYSARLPEDRRDEFLPLATVFNTMAGRLEIYERSNLAKLMRERNRLRAVVDRFDEPLLGIGADGRVLFANERMKMLLDLSADPDGVDVSILAENNQLLRRLLERPPEAPSEESRQLLKIVLEGDERLFAQNDVIIDPAEGHGTADRLVILHDVTDFVRKDARKTQFMATLSHELKTPVAAIEMAARLLDDDRVGPLNTEQREYLELVETNNDRIREMIGEVLDIAKIESGSLDLQLKPVEPAALLRAAVAGVRPFLAERQLEVREEITGDLGSVNVDEHKLLWSVNNLLINAIRYTPVGRAISVAARAEADGVRLEVRDPGPGIAPEQRRRIFEKYVQLSPRGEGGTGLGLAIAKEFVEAMGGRIGLDSELGEGSTFWIWLPEASPADR